MKGALKALEFWVVIMICLPVLYATGSLRRAAGMCGAGPLPFILYFLIGLGLTLVPNIYVFNTGISLSGAYLSLSAFIYVIVKRKLDYRFFIALAAALAVSAADFILSNAYFLPYMVYVVSAFISVSALFIYRGQAALFIPSMVLVFDTAGFLISLTLGIGHNYILLGSHEPVLYGIAVCLFSSYAFGRYRGRHVRRAHS